MTTAVMERNEATRDQVRDDLHAASRGREVAMQRYEAALMQAREEGWSNSQVARALGITEAAVRLYWKRHPNLRGSSLNLNHSSEVVSREVSD